MKTFNNQIKQNADGSAEFNHGKVKQCKTFNKQHSTFNIQQGTSRKLSGQETRNSQLKKDTD